MATAEQQLAHAWQIHQQKNYAQAEAVYRSVLSQNPNHASAWCYLGIALHDQRKFPEAVTAYRNALKLQPKFPIALNNMGNSLRYTGDYEEADSCFQKAIDLDSNYLNAFKNRGTLHVWTGGIEKGLGYYEQALKINPDEAELHRNLGVIYLLQGRFEEGWREYRWRWKVGDLHRPFSHIPVWDGSDLRGKSIVLAAEQGLGDTLNFVRYTKLLRERGAQTMMYCQTPLMALLQSSPEVGPVYPNSLQLDRQFDFQASLLDVADLLKTDLESIPGDSPYLQANPGLVSYWQPRLPNPERKLRVGINWQGNPDHQADVFRSVPLRCFEVLSEIEGVQLISLQAGFGTEQLKSWRGKNPIGTLGDNIDKSSGAFMDTAAILHQLDLVITSDTAIAHLAGALNIPTWIALSYVPDWRWLLDREDSPWYPSVRLFRQSEIGQWDQVFSRIAAQLRPLVQQKHTE